jgi:hypothetical protein
MPPSPASKSAIVSALSIEFMVVAMVNNVDF